MIKQALGALAAAGAMTMASMSPAAAHSATAYHGSDYAQVGVSHIQIFVHDRECDSHQVYAEWVHLHPVTLQPLKGSTWDTNGCNTGYGTSAPRNIISFRVCEVSEGCSAWRQA